MKTENPLKINVPLSATPLRACRWSILLLAPLFVAGAVLAANALHGKGTFTGRATLTPVSLNQIAVDINVAGNVTFLGKSTVHIHTLADGSGPVPTPIPPSTGVITAANGDTIAFTLRWTLQEVSPGRFDTIGPFDITGGTGRFKGATGSGDYRGVVDTNNGDVSAEITGELGL